MQGVIDIYTSTPRRLKLYGVRARQGQGNFTRVYASCAMWFLEMDADAARSGSRNAVRLTFYVYRGLADKSSPAF